MAFKQREVGCSTPKPKVYTVKPETIEAPIQFRAFFKGCEVKSIGPFSSDGLCMNWSALLPLDYRGKRSSLAARKGTCHRARTSDPNGPRFAMCDDVYVFLGSNNLTWSLTLKEQAPCVCFVSFVSQETIELTSWP